MAYLLPPERRYVARIPMFSIKPDFEPLPTFEFERMVGRPLYYDKRGRPLPDVMAWSSLFQDRNYQRVGATIIGHGPCKRWVSTVWLGLNHSFYDGPPLIFETMIFPRKKGDHIEVQWRYSTEAQAIIGHGQTCSKYAYNRKQRRRYQLVGYMPRQGRRPNLHPKARSQRRYRWHSK